MKSASKENITQLNIIFDHNLISVIRLEWVFKNHSDEIGADRSKWLKQQFFVWFSRREVFFFEIYQFPTIKATPSKLFYLYEFLIHFYWPDDVIRCVCVFFIIVFHQLETVYKVMQNGRNKEILILFHISSWSGGLFFFYIFGMLSEFMRKCTRKMMLSTINCLKNVKHVRWYYKVRKAE